MKITSLSEFLPYLYFQHIQPQRDIGPDFASIDTILSNSMGENSAKQCKFVECFTQSDPQPPEMEVKWDIRSRGDSKAGCESLFRTEPLLVFKTQRLFETRADTALNDLLRSPTRSESAFPDMRENPLPRLYSPMAPGSTSRPNSRRRTFLALRSRHQRFRVVYIRKPALRQLVDKITLASKRMVRNLLDCERGLDDQIDSE